MKTLKVQVNFFIDEYHSNALHLVLNEYFYVDLHNYRINTRKDVNMFLEDIRTMITGLYKNGRGTLFLTDVDFHEEKSTITVLGINILIDRCKEHVQGLYRIGKNQLYDSVNQMVLNLLKEKYSISEECK